MKTSLPNKYLIKSTQFQMVASQNIKFTNLSNPKLVTSVIQHYKEPTQIALKAKHCLEE